MPTYALWTGGKEGMILAVGSMLLPFGGNTCIFCVVFERKEAEMKRLFTLVLAVSVAMFATAALACGGHGKGKKFEIAEKTGGGYVVTMTAEGTAEEIAAAADHFAKKVEGCQAGTCKCPHMDVCPYNVAGLKYEVAKTATGATLTVTGDAEKLKEFKTRFDKKQEWRAKHGGECGCGGSGDCGCGGKGNCKCGADCKCGKAECGGKGECGCGGEAKGECPFQKEGGEHKCGCQHGDDPMKEIMPESTGECPFHK